MKLLDPNVKGDVTRSSILDANPILWSRGLPGDLAGYLHVGTRCIDEDWRRQGYIRFAPAVGGR
jgi:hypothetical protein